MGRGTRISSLPAQSPWREPDGRRGQGTGRGTLLQGRVGQNRIYKSLKRQMQSSFAYNWSQDCNSYRVDIEMSKLASAVGCKFGGPEEREKGLKEAFKVWIVWKLWFVWTCKRLCVWCRSLTKMVLEHWAQRSWERSWPRRVRWGWHTRRSMRWSAKLTGAKISLLLTFYNCISADGDNDSETLLFHRDKDGKLNYAEFVRIFSS